MAFIRKVKTASGATAVQIAYKSSGRIVKIEHLGSAHTKEEVEILISLAKNVFTKVSSHCLLIPSLLFGLALSSRFPAYCSMP